MLARRLLIGGGQAVSFRVDRLRAFHSALASVGTSPVDILAIGDSITLGQAATSVGARWLEIVGSSLVVPFTEYLVTPLGDRLTTPTGDYLTTALMTNPLAVHYPPVWDAARPFANPWSNTGSPTVNLHFGPGRIAGNLTTGKTMSYTFTGTGFDLYYAQGPSGSGFGQFSYAVDGGSATTVDARNATQTGSRRVQVTGLSAGSHTVALAPVSASVPIEGIIGYDGTETSGIRVWNGGHGGYTSAQFTDPAEPWWIDILDTVEPDLVIIELGTNDCVLGAPTAAQFKANLQTIIADIRAVVTTPPSFLIVALYQALGRTTWVDYVAAMSDVVALDPYSSVALLDLVPYFGGYVDVPAGGNIAADRIHLTTAGHAYVAGLIEAAIA